MRLALALGGSFLAGALLCFFVASYVVEALSIDWPRPGGRGGYDGR